MIEMIKNIACVNVIAEFTSEGVLIPLAVRWKDGRLFEIDSITYSNRCIGVMTSKASQRFLVKIAGQDRYLFYEANGKWFIEDRHTVLENGC